jgi:hypothetical protein
MNEFVHKCLGITYKFISSYQFIILLSCSYIFQQLCAIVRESSVPSELHANLGFWSIKICVVCGCVYVMW